MTALTPFDPEAKCPKCGHDDVRVNHVGGYRYSCTHEAKPRHPETEHLDRTCQRCHFGWAEAVLA